MKKKTSVVPVLTQEEMQIIERLREHPEIRERLQSILEMTGSQEGPLKRADEVEELLIEEMRRLGHVTMSQWARQAEERVSTELQQQDSTVRSRKKKR
jgi:hypothetical protein